MLKRSHIWTMAVLASMAVASPTHAAKVYWATGDSGGGNAAIHRADLDGSNAEVILVTGAEETRSFAFDVVAEKMYYAVSLTGGSGNRVQRADLDGTNVEDLALVFLAIADFVALDLTAGKVYWTLAGGTPQIVRADLNGSNPQIVISSTATVSGVAVDAAAGSLFWLSNDSATDYSLHRADLDGANDQILLSLTGSVGRGLTVADGTLFWPARDADVVRRIHKANADGSNPGTIAVVSDLVFGIVANPLSGKLYWGSLAFPSGSVMRADLDGSNVVTVIGGINIGPSTVGLLVDAGAIPAVSTWGLVVASLMLAAVGTLIYARKGQTPEMAVASSSRPSAC